MTLDLQHQLLSQKIDALQRLVEARFAANDKALELQAIETHRRLAILNGEHATLTQMKDDFVLRVVYDKDQDRAREDSIAAKLSVEQQRQTNMQITAVNRRNTLVIAMTLAIALIGWAITLALKFLPGVPA